jgi:hypothetical protein
MRENETEVNLRLAMADVQNELERRIKTGHDLLACSARLVDEVERTIDDIADQRLRRELRQLVDMLDEHRATVDAGLAGISTYDLWDPLRTLVVDLRAGLL